MNRYPLDLRQKVIQDAQRIGLVRSAKLNHVSPQSAVTWCHASGVFLKRLGQQKACVICGKIFTYRPGTSRMCCSRTCRAKYDHETRTCLQCGQSFIVIKSKVQKYCSHACYAQSNRVDNQESKRRGSNWGTIRRRFKETPRPCEMCGLPATDLHHIIPFKYFKGDWQKANVESNRIALCRDCHHKAERYVRRVYAVIDHLERNGIRDGQNQDTQTSPEESAHTS